MTTNPAHTNPSRRRGNLWAWAWVWVVCVGVAESQLHPYFPDFPGSYCRARYPDQCCRNRFDSCSLPIDGTLCYCDEFCVRSSGSDCCPDYYEVCLGIPRRTTPPPQIYDSCISSDGTIVPHGYSFKDNCNLCKCHLGRMDCEQDVCMVDPDLLERVNRSPRLTWRASNYSMFWGHKASQGLTYKTGTHHPETTSSRMYPVLLRPQFIPREFDARTKPEWRNLISGISDQEWCGSSWAFSTLGVAQDRVAIETAGQEVVRLSPQHLLSCDRTGQSGCEGGHVEFAWQFLRRTGTVEDSCFPYVSGSDGHVPTCPSRGRQRSVRCADAYTVRDRDDLYHLEPSYRISGKEEDIQWEIMQNGPVQAVMDVYRDFFMYREGIYSHTWLEGSDGGGPAMHSVRILGWGEDNAIKYWLCANSWGRAWGENGYFRIRRGTNESNIETFVLAVRANFNSGRLRRYRLGGGPGPRGYRRRGRRTRKNHNHHSHHNNHIHHHGNKQ